MKGFTLIELLVVLAIIGIMTSAIFVNMNKVGASNELKLAGRQLAAAISQTQNYALAGKTKGDNYPCSFKFSTLVKDDGFYYKIEYIPRKINEECGENNNTFELFEGPEKFEKIENVTLGSVIFTVPHAKYTPLSSAYKDKTEFEIKKNNMVYKVVVNSSGLIQEGNVGN